MSLLVEEFFLLLFGVGTLILSLKRNLLPHLTPAEVKVLILLFTLLVAVKGLELSGVLRYFALRLERFKHFPPLLVLYTALLSMFATNDAALLSVVPLTLLLEENRALIPLLVVLEILAANIGSALSPFGNPQNIFLYHHYRLTLTQFLSAVLPVFLPLLVFLLILTPTKGKEITRTPIEVVLDLKTLSASVATFFLFLGVFFRLLPLEVLFSIPFLGLFKKELLKVDYNLLLTLAVFFAFSNLLEEQPLFHSPEGVLINAVLLSQVISNVPAAVILAKLTTLWKPLLVGANIGGFGTPVASLANLIAIKFYLKSKSPFGVFLFLYVVLNLSFLIMGISVAILTLDLVG